MRIEKQQDSVTALWRSRIAGADSLQERLRAAGAAGAITHGFSGYPGIDKVFGSPRLRVLSLDITCEDYGLLARLAERRQSPRLRVNAATESRGERPVFNTIAEIRGRELPNEYVVLSAHFDSWSASIGMERSRDSMARARSSRITRRS
ncbi:MAG: hypothetical protein ACT4PJ_14760 [Gemmatimonadaceae bacterium]